MALYTEFLDHAHEFSSSLVYQMIPTLTSFSESPRHLLTIELAEILKNVVLHSVATAFASNVLPEIKRTEDHLFKKKNAFQK